MKVDKTPFPNVNMVDVAPTSQQSPSEESFASLQRMRSAIEQGCFIARTARGEHGAPIFPSINMVSFTHSSKGKEKADPDDDRLLEFKLERHMSAKEVARNRRV